MTDLMLEATPARLMTAEEDELARSFYSAVQHATNNTPRSLQAAGHRIGVSDLGFCSERVRRHLAGQSEPEVDHLPAFIGTALGDHIEQAVSAMFPNLIRQAEVSIVLHGDTGDFILTGHPDIIDPAGRVVDVKTTDGLGRVRRTGPSQQQQFQRHLYAKAAHQAGLFETGLDQVQVADIWFDRSARERECYVHLEPYDERVVEAAVMWLDDIVYSFLHDDIARKEPPREMCFKACGFAPDCRGGDTDVRGLITDAELLASVDLYTEAVALERQARRMKDEAKSSLTGVVGSTGKHSVRWTKVGGGHVEYYRQPYERLDIKPVGAL